MKKNNGGLSHSVQELYVIHLGEQYFDFTFKSEKLFKSFGHLQLLNSDVESFQLSLVFLQRDHLEDQIIS